MHILPPGFILLLNFFYVVIVFRLLPISVVMRSKPKVCSSFIVGIAVSNPSEVMDIRSFCLLCVLQITESATSLSLAAGCVSTCVRPRNLKGGGLSPILAFVLWKKSYKFLYLLSNLSAASSKLSQTELNDY